MGDPTENFGFATLGAGDSLAENEYQFGVDDRHLLDYLIARLMRHEHTGVDDDASAPDAPVLTLSTTGGTIPAGTTVSYVITLVDPETGESLRSDEASVVTADPLDPPDAPDLAYQTTGGTHDPGTYQYILSAYQGETTVETKAVNLAEIVVPVGTSTNEIEIIFPDLPAGATGFNIYRKEPNQTRFYFLDSSDQSGPTPDASYFDDGSIDCPCDRTRPPSNTTNGTNSVLVEYPGPTPDVPEDNAWKIYRTYASPDWETSFLTQRTDEQLDYTDTGASTSTGRPPAGSVLLESPDKITLTDAEEVEGSLPPGMVPHLAQFVFAFPGPVETQTGTFRWFCEHPYAQIISCRGGLGVGSSPANSDVIFDVNKGTYLPGAPTPIEEAESTIFTTQANRPTVPVGEEIGDDEVPDIVLLERGDYLTCDIDQEGGGATPTDEDGFVVVHYIAYGYPTDTSFTAGAATTEY